MFKKLFNAKASISALLIAIVFAMFIGCFANAPRNMDKSFSGKYWYYLNRGYPEPYTGWTLQGTNVAFPHVKLPFIVTTGKDKLEKIIDLAQLAPVLLTIFLLTYIPAYLFAKVVDENKKLFAIWVIGNVMVVTVGIYIYFFWLPLI